MSLRASEEISLCTLNSHSKKSPLSGSNQRPTDYKSVALPAELRRLIIIYALASNKWFANVGAFPENAKQLRHQSLKIFNFLASLMISSSASTILL